MCLSDIILTDYNRLEPQPTRKPTAATVPDTINTMVVPVDVCVCGRLLFSPTLENDEKVVPFTTMTTSTTLQEN